MAQHLERAEGGRGQDIPDYLDEYFRVSVDSDRMKNLACIFLESSISSVQTRFDFASAKALPSFFDSTRWKTVFTGEDPYATRIEAFQKAINTLSERDLLLLALEDATSQLMVSRNTFAAMANKFVQNRTKEASALLTGTELGAALGISEERVRQRLQNGRLIAILREGRERGRGFPAFQALEGIAGEPLEKVLRALGYSGPTQESGTSAAEAYQFFTGSHELIGGLAPFQVLLGIGADVNDVEALEFLSKPHAERLAFIVSIAEATHAGKGSA